MAKKDIERRIPEHIGIIMDGNGRWAKRRGMPRVAGHTYGASTFKKITRYANQIGVKFLTVYAFSTENWKRPEEEVGGILNLLRRYLKDAEQFKAENIKVLFVGDIPALPDDIQEMIRYNEELSADATGMQLNIAFNYGGREEILNAVRKLAERAVRGEISPADITGDMFESCLYTHHSPDVDLLIRTSGEYRTSNYLIWQSTYAELWFTDVLWPDFKKKHLEQAIDDFNKRDRRLGGV